MSLFLRLHKVCNECGFIWYPKDEAISSNCPNCNSENTSNEKFNFIATVLFYLTGLIVLGLVIFSLQDSEPPPAVEPLSAVEDSLTKAEQQIELPEIEEEAENAVAPAKAPLAAKPADIETLPAPVVQAEIAPLPLPPSAAVVESAVTPKAEPAPVEDLRPVVNVSTNQITFSLWSVSELRLRRAYTNLLNDGSIRTELNRKDYFHFVSNRAKKCGELDPSFEKNINSIESIKFKANDARILECYASENTSEYNRLNIATEVN